MKTNLLRPVFSLFAVAFAVFAAFAFTPAPETGKLADVWGHDPNNDCEVTGIRCQDVNNNIPCRISGPGTELFQMSGETNCTIELYKKL